MGQGKAIEGAHKFGLLFTANEQVIGAINRFIRRVRDFIE